MSALIRLLSLLAATLLLAACATPGHSPTTLRPFTTDGCSLFPDRSADGKKDWHCCCVQHDRRYWRGGPASLRLQADEELRACVATTTGDAGLARVMYAGVRVGGLAHWPTSFRWGYGWGYGRGYAPLTEGEQREADRLEGEYAGATGFGRCPGAITGVSAPETGASAPRCSAVRRASGGADSGPRACSDDH